jgi:Transposase DDE domain
MGPGSGSRTPSTRQPLLPPKPPSACPNGPGSAPCATTSHGKELVRYVAELELGNVYGPTGPVRLVAATLDPSKLDPDNTWYLATPLSLKEASPEQVYELYRLRDWIEQYYKPAKHELGWADYQMRPEQAIVRHWHLVMLAFTRHAC